MLRAIVLRHALVASVAAAACGAPEATAPRAGPEIDEPEAERPRPVVVVSDLSYPTELAADDEAYFFLSRPRDSLLSITRSGARRLILAEVENAAGPLVLHEEHVYLLRGSTAIVRVRRRGGPPEAVVEGGTAIWAFVIDRSELVWFGDVDGSSGRVRAGAIWAKPIDGGEPRGVAETAAPSAAGLAVVRDQIAFCTYSTDGSRPRGILWSVSRKGGVPRERAKL